MILGSSLRPGLAEVVAALRAVIGGTSRWPERRMALEAALAGAAPRAADLLTPDELAGRVGGCGSFPVWTAPDSSHSLVAFVARPGQGTSVHDHLTWGAVVVLQGIEREERFALDPATGTLALAGTRDHHRGDANAFRPPDDIHRITSVGSAVAVSLHLYGTDISRAGSSVRRYYPYNPESRQVSRIHPKELS